MNKIKELRLEKKLKQSELVRIVGVSQNTISYWEIGKYEPDIEALKKLSEYFNVSINYLIGETGTPTPNKNQPPLQEVGTVEWFKQGLVKYGVVKNGEKLTDAQLQFLLDNVSFIAERLKDKQINNNGE